MSNKIIENLEIQKVILQNKIRKVSDELHNQINKIKTKEELLAFIENNLNFSVKDKI